MGTYIKIQNYYENNHEYRGGRMEPKTNGIIKTLKSHSRETGTKPFTTQIQYKPFSNPEYYEYTNSSVLIRFKNTVFDTKSNIKLFPDSHCQNFPSTDNLFLKFTDDSKSQTFNTRLLLDTIRKLEKTQKRTSKKLKNTVLLIFHITIVVLLTSTIVHCQTASELIVTT